MRRITKLGLIALTLLAAVSCRNIVFIPVDTGSSPGGGVVISDSDAYQKTYAEVSWDSVVQQAVAQAGQGDKGGMISELVEAAEAPEIGASFRMAPRPLAEEPSIANLVLSITFTGGYVDDASGVTINSGSMEFTLTANRTKAEDPTTSTVETRYDVQSYTATTVALSMTATDSTTTATVTAETIASDAASMTVTVKAEVTAGTSITDATAINVSLEVSTSTTGNVTINDTEHDAETVKPETPVVEPTIGSEEKPYEVASEADIEKIASMIETPSETFYVHLAKDIVLKENQTEATIVIPADYNVDIDLGGFNISRISSAAATDDTVPDSVGDDSRYIFDVSGTLTVRNGSVGGTLFVNPSARIFQVMEGGHLILDEVTACSYGKNGGSTLYAFGGSNVEIYSSELYSSTCVFSLSVGANATVRDSKIASVSSNKLQSYFYAVIADGTLDIDTTEVYGVQGAISASGKDCVLGEGVVAATIPNIFDEVPEDYETYYRNWDQVSDLSGGTIPNNLLFYAIYAAGEEAEDVSTIVKGGTYYSYSPYSTILVGNSNDGGAGHAAYAEIQGGTFENRGAGYVVKDVSGIGPADYGYGQLTITGGSFKDSKDNTKEWLEGFVDPSTHKVSDAPDADGYYTVTAL